MFAGREAGSTTAALVQLAAPHLKMVSRMSEEFFPRLHEQVSGTVSNCEGTRRQPVISILC